ncbi:MAG: PilN domain-containing protein [Pseudomonadota bacterium]
MAQINLLPWREEKRQLLNRNFYVHCGISVLLGFILIMSVDWFIHRGIDEIELRNSYISQEISKLEQTIKEIESLKRNKEELQARMKVIQDLQGNRSLIVHYFDEIARLVPEGLYLNKLERTGDDFKIDGVSVANNRVSNFSRNLDDSPWFENSKTVSLASITNREESKFQMTVSKEKTKEEKEAIAGQEGDLQSLEATQ